MAYMSLWKFLSDHKFKEIYKIKQWLARHGVSEEVLFKWLNITKDTELIEWSVYHELVDYVSFLSSLIDHQEVYPSKMTFSDNKFYVRLSDTLPFTIVVSHYCKAFNSTHSVRFYGVYKVNEVLRFQRNKKNGTPYIHFDGIFARGRKLIEIDLGIVS